MMPRLLGYALRRTHVAVTATVLRALSDINLHPTQVSVLTVIDRNPGLKQTKIGDVLGIQKGNLAALLNGLERRGLLERRDVEADRRAKALFLTKKGEEIIAQANSARSPMSAKSFGDLARTIMKTLFGYCTSSTRYRSRWNRQQMKMTARSRHLEGE